MLKIRRPLGRLIFNMGIAIPGKTVFLIETAPCTSFTCDRSFSSTAIGFLFRKFLLLWCGISFRVLHWEMYYGSVNMFWPSLHILLSALRYSIAREHYDAMTRKPFSALLHIGVPLLWESTDRHWISYTDRNIFIKTHCLILLLGMNPEVKSTCVLDSVYNRQT